MHFLKNCIIHQTVGKFRKSTFVRPQHNTTHHKTPLQKISNVLLFSRKISVAICEYFENGVDVNNNKKYVWPRTA